MKDALPLDLIIIGAGPIGLACAIEAQQKGLSYLVLEKGTIVNSIFYYPVNMTFFSTSERLEIGNIPFVSNSAKPTRNEALEYYRRVAQHFNLQLQLFEAVENVVRENEVYKVQSSKAGYACRSIVIASGFYDIPYPLNISGEDLPKVKHYYDDPHFYAFQKVVVVGAANSAVDAALETWRKGADVTMIVRGDRISDRVKYWVKPDIENRIKEGSIKAHFNSSIKEIHPHKVVVQTPDGDLTIENDWVLAMTGYQPNLHFLRKLGIALSSDEVCMPLIDEQTMETNQPNIFLAGVICGGMNTHRLFIENSREHAIRIVAEIARRKRENTI